MARTTQLGPGAYPGQSYGSFAGKSQPAAVSGFMPAATIVEVVTPSRGAITEITLPNRGTILDE